MNRRGLGFVAVILVLGIAALFWWREREPHPELPSSHSSDHSAAQDTRTVAANKALLELPLGGASTTIHDDVHLLAETLARWQTNFPSTGNPVGTNAEITAALCGDNALKLDLISRDHPAINARGELCDRWGTPFRFHQLSGTQMEIISAGPDRHFATADDVRTP